MNQQRVEHRCAKTRLRLVDYKGNAFANQEVTVRQTNQEMLFGCGVPGVLEFMREGGHTKEFEDCMTKWLDLFNYGTLHFYWGMFEREEGKLFTLNMLRAANYLKERNIKMKGHPLCWHTVCPQWLLQYDNDTILKKQLQRIRREVSDFRGLVDVWDAINEVVIMPDFREDNGVSRICKEYGRVKTVKMMFDEAKATNPDAYLLINDFNLSTKYEDLIDDCLNAGVPIDAIGIQTHQHQGYLGKERIQEILDRFGKFGLPLHFTENTIISGDLMPKEIVDLNDYQPKSWPSTQEGEERQARELEEMYRILFEHPQVEAITAWDFADGAWLGAPSGIVHKDFSEKPVYHMLKKLIKEEWTTNVTLKTDENGWITLDGYRGEYELNVSNHIGKYQLKKGVKDTIVQLI